MRLATVITLLGLLAIGYAKKCPRQRTSPGKEILCYTATNDVDQLANTICRCTTLVHQGHELHNISITGVEELKKSLKELNPVLQVVVSVKDPQGTLRTSATSRQEASGRLATVLSKVDGVELDMTAGSKERLTHFVKGLKDEMIRKSNEKRIILALPTKAEDLAKQYDMKTLAKYVNLFTLSTHYLVDNGESFNTFHPSRLMGIFDMLNTDSLVDLVSGLGVPKNMLLVSIPGSAYKFTLKDDGKNAPGSSAKEERPAAISQKELCDMMSAGEWTVERDTDLTAPYAFKDSTWIAFEDKTSVGIKGKYVLLRELAGLGIHDVENDVKNDCGKPVTEEVYRSFTDMKRKTRGAVLASLENDLSHVEAPTSRHVRSSEFRIVRVVDTTGAIHAIRENTQTEFICTRQGYFVHPKSCNRFYRCVKFNQGIDDYSVFEFDCPAGLAFDERTEVCVWPGSLTEGSPCPGSSEIAPVPRSRFRCPARNGYYADPQNCRWFFACYDLGEPELTAYEFRCPFGLVFDEQKLICEWPWLVSGCGTPGYTRNEYGGSDYGAKLPAHGIGFGQGTGYGHDTGTDVAGDGQYGNDGSSHGGSGAGGYGGSGAGGYDGSGQGGSGAGGYGGSGQGGSGAGGYGGSGQGGSGAGGNAGSGHGGSGAGGYGGSGQGGSGAGGYDGSGQGGSGAGGYGGSGQGGSSAGGYGSSGQRGSGAGGNAGSGHGGSGAGGYDGSGQGGSGAGGYGGSGQGGSGAGGYGGSGQGGSGAGGNAGSGHGGSGAGGYGGSGQGGSGAGGYGGSGQGESDAGGYGGSGHGGSGAGGYGGSGAGGNDGSGHGGSGAGAYGGSGQGGSGAGSSASGGSHNTGGSGNEGYGASEYGNSGYQGSGAGGSGYGGSVGGSSGHGGPVGGGSGYGESAGGGSEYGGSAEGGSGYEGSAGVGSGYGGSAGGGSGYEESHGAAGGSGHGGSTAGVSGYRGSVEAGSGYAGSHGTDSSIHEGSYGAGGSGYGGSSTVTSGYRGNVEAGSKYAGSHGTDGSVHGGSHSTVSSEYGGSHSGTSGYEGSTSAGGAGGSHGAGGLQYGGFTTGSSGYAGSHGSDGSVYEESSGSAGSEHKGFGVTESNYGGHGGSGSSSSVYHASGIDGSLYAGSGTDGSGGVGSGTSESRYTETGTGQQTGVTGGVGDGIILQQGVSDSQFSGEGSHGSSYAGSGVTGSGYSIEHTVSGAYAGAGSTGTSYVGAGNAGAQNSAGYQTGTTASGYDVTGGFVGNSGIGIGVTGHAGETSGYNGIANTIGNYGGGSAGIGKDGFTVSVETGGSQGGFSGVTGSGYNVHSGTSPYSGNQIGVTTGSVFSIDSGASVSDGQDVVNGGFNSGHVILTGTTGSGYSAGSSGFANENSAGYSTAGEKITDSSDVINGGINSGTVILTGTTGSGYSAGANGGTSGYTGGSGHSSAGVLVHSVTPGYPVITASDGSGSYTGSSGKLEYTDNGAYVTGSGYEAGNTGSGNVVIDHGSQINGGESGAYENSGSSSSVNNYGKGDISTGTTTYHGNGGTSNTYSTSKTSKGNANDVHNAYVTSNAESGTVVNANADQRSIYQSTVRPGYISTNPVTPGYTINGVTQTTFGGQTSGGFGTGGSAGQSFTASSGYGNTREQIEAEFPGSTGGDFGIKTSHSATGSFATERDMGYKTNEYHDNGGRGTIVHNNGVSTSKYTESDIRDRQPAYASLPDTIVSGGRIDGSNGVVLGTTVAGIDTYVSQGFTKTGPTKTGIVAAEIGGSGSYVTNTGRPRPTPTPSNPEFNTFGGKKTTEGYTAGNSIGSEVNGLAYVTSTFAPDASYVDTSKINLGHTTSAQFSGYKYDKPTVSFVDGGTPIPTSVPSTVTYHQPIVPLTVTTPSSHLNVEVYNTPSVVTSAPITAGPAVVNTYSYSKPANGYKQSSYQTVTVTGSGDTASTAGYKYKRPTQTSAYQNSGDSLRQTTIYKRPFDGQNRYTVTPTPSPIAYATGPADIYKTTLFEAAKQPVTLSTVAPVFDTGYKTVVSSTSAPITVTTAGQYYYKDRLSSTAETMSDFDITYQQPEFNFQKTTASNTQDGYVYKKPNNPLTYDSVSTVTPSVTVYKKQPSVTIQQQNKYTQSVTSAVGSKGAYDRPSVSIRPAIGKQPAVITEFSSGSAISSGTDFEGYKYSKPSVTFESTPTVSIYTHSQGYTDGNEGSPTKLNIPKDEVKKLVGNYNNRGGVKYSTVNYDDGRVGDQVSGSYGNSGVSRGQSFNNFGNKASVTSQAYVSTTSSPSYEASTPDSIIRTNSYDSYATSGRGSSRYTGGYTASTPLYEIATVKPSGANTKGKVIVKLSDLHPLLLGKLGAQCTCRSDPFETLRGPGVRKPLPIKSSKGDIDLANYDESEIYVDLETDREPEQSAAVYRTPNGSQTPPNRSYARLSSPTTPATAIFAVGSPATTTVLRSRGKPASAHLPASSISSSIGESRGGSSSGSKTPPLENGSYGSPSDISDSEYVGTPSGFEHGDIPIGRSVGGTTKAGKSLRISGAPGNALGGQGAAFDRYGPGGWRDVDETLQGTTDCARPGLFRHPKFCNKFYACHWDEWKQKFTLHVFNCPVHLSFDNNAGACNWPTKGPACQDDNLLV
ncbi:mucin-19-like isoform X3 [Athalia rosae]|uniref:mucin-19-like isoform X3 n=1 Tax=Athalia rosae TaxID=37344 RepID=UPI0020348D37|nr:mucin-19-like isoform X3 [Athalia rosae]